MKTFWGDCALVDNLEKNIVKDLRKESYFQKHYDSSKAKELKTFSNLVPILNLSDAIEKETVIFSMST